MLLGPENLLLKKSRAMVADDLSDLVSRPPRPTGAMGHRLRRQRVEEGSRGLEPVDGHPGVAGRRPDGPMAEHLLDDTNVGAGFELVRCEAVPKDVGSHSLGQLRGAARLRQGLAHAPGTGRAPSNGSCEEKGRLRPLLPPMGAKPIQQGAGQRDEARSVALASTDVDDPHVPRRCPESRGHRPRPHARPLRRSSWPPRGRSAAARPSAPAQPRPRSAPSEASRAPWGRSGTRRRRAGRASSRRGT